MGPLRKLIRNFLSLACTIASLSLCAQRNTVSTISNHFSLSSSSKSVSIFVGEHDYPGVLRAAKSLQEDINRVTDRKPELRSNNEALESEIVILGTLGKNQRIDQLINTGKLNVKEISGQWEAYLIQEIENPFPNVNKALVIAGSDKRGTIFGIYEISRRIGVSPWYWWADVPVVKQENLLINGERFIDAPKVKYRGIFINDEAPALSGWTTEKFGGFNHQFYEKVYELILRLKGNFLWPAMWGRAIYDDDSISAPLADEYGIVIGTSHHEPMMRAHVEWDRYGKGGWNYEKNDSTLREFWRKGIERMGDNESIVTLAMRGDGDMAMSKETNVALLEKIVKDQREILREVTGKDIEQIPQVWALYKEVQEYYDQGMRVPDDVTLLLCDDNWGNIRKLPKLTDAPRKGGYGIYYHFDYVGGPRNYKWLNTNQISRVWEQMNLAWNHGVDRIWVVNVGDIKPMEVPIEFFLNMAWNPEKWNPENLAAFTLHWAQREFGNKHAEEIAHLYTTYTNYNSRRKPELLSHATYSLVNYKEAETIVNDYHALVGRAEKIYNALEEKYKDAFYQLILFPIQACANLNDLYVTAGLNKLYVSQGRVAANDMADKVSDLFARDAALSNYYNTKLAGGKWSHMMDQTHIGYTIWQQPEKNIIPKTEHVTPKQNPEMGVAIEGSTEWWPQSKAIASLPEFDNLNNQKSYFEIFNRGTGSFTVSIKPGESWIKLSSLDNPIDRQQRIEVTVDWTHVPEGEHQVPITIKSIDGAAVVVNAHLKKTSPSPTGFIERNGYLSIEAAHYQSAQNTSNHHWESIPNLGRTLSGVTLLPPVPLKESELKEKPFIEYEFYSSVTGEVDIQSLLSPTLNFHYDALKMAISVDDETPKVVDIHGNYSGNQWNSWVANNVNTITTKHTLNHSGQHKLRVWAIDPGVVFQKFIINTGALKESYLGPSESLLIKK